MIPAGKRAMTTEVLIIILVALVFLVVTVLMIKQGNGQLNLFAGLFK